MENYQPTLQEKTTAMEKAIRMAKEVHEKPANASNHAVGVSISTECPEQKTDVLTTAKQIYDWLLTT